MTSVGRKHAFLGDGQWKFSRRAAGCRDRVELIIRVVIGVATGAEENALTVRRPAHDFVVGGMVSQPFRLPPGGGHHVDIAIAGVAAGKGNHRTVRRKPGVNVGAGCGRQAVGISAAATHRPKIAAVGKDDLCLADRRFTQKKRRGLRLTWNTAKRRNSSTQGEDKLPHEGLLEEELRILASSMPLRADRES